MATSEFWQNRGSGYARTYAKLDVALNPLDVSTRVQDEGLPESVPDRVFGTERCYDLAAWVGDEGRREQILIYEVLPDYVKRLRRAAQDDRIQVLEAKAVAAGACEI